MRVAICLSALLLGFGPAVAKECRMPDLPPGARVAVPPECRDRLRSKDSQADQDGLQADRGFVDLGNGTKVRVGGQIGAEFGFRR